MYHEQGIRERAEHIEHGPEPFITAKIDKNEADSYDLAQKLIKKGYFVRRMRIGFTVELKQNKGLFIIPFELKGRPLFINVAEHGYKKRGSIVCGGNGEMFHSYDALRLLDTPESLIDCRFSCMIKVITITGSVFKTTSEPSTDEIEIRKFEIVTSKDRTKAKIETKQIFHGKPDYLPSNLEKFREAASAAIKKSHSIGNNEDRYVAYAL